MYQMFEIPPNRHTHTHKHVRWDYALIQIELSCQPRFQHMLDPLNWSGLRLKGNTIPFLSREQWIIHDKRCNDSCQYSFNNHHIETFKTLHPMFGDPMPVISRSTANLAVFCASFELRRTMYTSSVSIEI